MPRLTVLAFCLCAFIGCSKDESQSTAPAGDGQTASTPTTTPATGHSTPTTTPGHSTPGHSAPGHSQHTAPGHTQHSQPGHNQHSQPGHNQQSQTSNNTYPMNTTPAPGHEQHSQTSSPMPTTTTPAPGHEQHSQTTPMPMTTTPTGHNQGTTTPMPGTTNPGDPNQAQNVPQFEEGSPEKAVYELVLQMIAQDPTSLADHISPNATGKLADIRDGKLTEEEQATLKEQFAQVRLLNTRRNSNGSNVVYLQNARGDSISIELRKVDGELKAHSMTIKSQGRPR